MEQHKLQEMLQLMNGLMISTELPASNSHNSDEMPLEESSMFGFSELIAQLELIADDESFD